MVQGILALAVTLAALAGTGLLIMRTYHERRPELIAWSLTMVGLSIALGAMAIGFLAGFGSFLFRCVEFGGAVVAPMALAVGIVLLITDVIQVRFATLLVAISYTFVASVIVLLDPLQGDFDSSLPKPGEHYEVLPLGLIDGAHVIAVITLVACAGVTAWRARNLDKAAYALLMEVALGALAGVLVVTGTRGFLPGLLAVVALGAATGLVWFGAQKIGVSAHAGRAQDDDGYDEAYDDGYEEPYQGRRRGGHRRAARYDEAEPQAGPQVEYNEYGDYDELDEDGTVADRYPAAPAGGRSPAGPPLSGGPQSPPPGLRFPADNPLGAPTPGGPSAAPVVGQVVIYTLREGVEPLFDQLMADAVRAARELEPDLLIFTCHEVTATPTQRICYRLFRDQQAMDAHERQPHIQRLLAEARPAVLATNVVDLRLNAAKIVPLPSFLAKELR